jgi:hypothetical protein
MPAAFESWLREGGTAPLPTIAAVDPASRREHWLLRTALTDRRSLPAYRDYAEAAARLGTHR